MEEGYITVELTKDQRDALLDLINQAKFPGSLAERVVDLIKALQEGKSSED